VEKIKGVDGQLFNTTRNLVALGQLIILKKSKCFLGSGAYNPTISAVWRKVVWPGISLVLSILVRERRGGCIQLSYPTTVSTSLLVIPLALISVANVAIL